MDKQPYFGSVLFFKHMIIGTIALLILIPTGLAILFAFQNSVLRAEAATMSAVVGQAEPPIEQEAWPIQTPQWQQDYPALYAKGGTGERSEDHKAVYLTFDDGPSARTPEVLEVLRRYDVKATFFVIGKEDEQSKQWLRDIVADGHTVGMHTYSHDYRGIYASVEAYLEDYNKIYQLIYETTGVAPEISRFPGGSINGYNRGVYQEIASELIRRGFVYYDWNVSSGDAAKVSGTPVEQIVQNSLATVNTIQKSAVVLMHDSDAKKTTVEALPRIIEGYQQAGFTFKPLTPDVIPIVFSYPE